MRILLVIVLAITSLTMRTDMTASMVDMWELAEASGNAVGAHAAITLTDTNTVTSGTCGGRAARDFERDVGEYFTAADSAALSLGSDTPMTLAVRVQFETAPGSTNFAILTKDDGATQREFHLQWVAGSGIAFSVWDSTGTPSTVTHAGTATPTTGVCYTIVAKHDPVNNLLILKVNDGAADTVAHSTGTQDSTAPFQIGNASGLADRAWDGLIGSAIYWKRVTSDAEDTELYNAGSGVAYADIDAGGAAPPCRRLLLGVGCEESRLRR